MKDLKGKRLLLLGGGMWKDAINSFAKNNGIVLVATGNDRSGGTFEIADEAYDVNSTNAEEMKKLIKEKNIDGVYMGGSEAVIACACAYLEEIGMPCYCTKEQWDLLQNKKLFKKLCQDHGLPTVPQYSVDFSKPEEIEKKLAFPLVTKPVDGSGSAGFSVCNNVQELIEGYEKAKVASDSGDVIIEKFVKNDSVVVIYTFSEGKAYFSLIGDKYPVIFKKQGSYISGAFVYESFKKSLFQERFNERLEKMFSAIRIKEGTIWIEVFNEGEDFYFNEAGYRYSGSVTVYPVDYFYAYNQVAADIYYALTGKSRISGFETLIKEKDRGRKFYSTYTLHMREGTIAKVIGLKEVCDVEGVVVLPVRLKEGAVVEESGTISQVFGFLHLVFDTEEEFKKIIKEALSVLQVLDTEGNNMIAPLLDIDKAKITV